MTGRKTVISAITGKRSYGSMTKGQKQTPDIYGSLRYTGAKNAVDALIKRNASKETTAGRPGTDHKRLRDTAEDEPEHPGRRLLCRRESGYGIPPLYLPQSG